MAAHPIAVIGPGAIGGAVAGALIESGHSVVVAARSSIDRIHVTHPAGHVSGDVTCFTDPRKAVPHGVVFLAVKAHQTESAGPWLRAMVGDSSTVYVAQNGVEHVERVRPFVPVTAEVEPVVVNLPASRTAAGEVKVAVPGRLSVPAGPSGDALAALIDSKFLSVHVVDDFVTAAWVKLMINASLGAFGVLTGRGNDAIATDPDARQFVLAIMHETAEVGRAEGAVIPQEMPSRVLDRILAAASGHISSITADRLGGRPTEWDARNAVVARIADRHGIDVPLNRMATALIRLGE